MYVLATFHNRTHAGRGVKIRYMASPVSSNVVEIGSGAIEEIAFLSDRRHQPAYRGSFRQRP